MADKTAVFREAQRFLSKGQVDKAIKAWQQYVDQHPDGNIFNTIGDLYLKSGNRSQAVEYFHRAAEYFKDEGFITKALALYKKILNIDKLDPQALFFIGRLNEEKGLVTDAIKYYLASIDAYVKHGAGDELVPICEKIIDLAPANISLRVKLADYLQKEGYLEESAREYFDIGRLSEEKGDLEKAREYYEKSLGLNPQQEDLYRVLSDLYLSLGLLEEAKDLLSRAAEVSPDNRELRVLYADLLLKSGDATGAKDVLLDIISASPEGDGDKVVIEANRLLGDIHLKEGDGRTAWERYRIVVDDCLDRGAQEEAVRILKEFRDVVPHEVSRRLIEIYTDLGRKEDLFEEYTALAELKAAEEDFEEALSLYLEAKKISPDSEAVLAKIAELEDKLGIASLEETEEKATDEKLVDVDIFLRYGLLDEAVDILERLKFEEPENIEVHKRLKTVYHELNDKEGVVTECLILARIHEKEGRIEQKEQVLKEAFEVDPEDPRLLELSGTAGEVSTAPSLEREFEGAGVVGLDDVTEPPLTEPEPPTEQEPVAGRSIEDFEEELSEAGFYARQGLFDEALSIYNRVLEVLPDNQDILGKIAEIREKVAPGEAPSEVLQEGPPPEEPAAAVGESGTPAEDLAGVDIGGVSGEPAGEIPSESLRGDEAPEEIPDSVSEGLTPESGPVGGDLVSEEPVEENVPEPSLDNEVLEIFEEFKKGISEELEETDSETHYNLGIAYKEMGLIDDAIKEFQTARRDPNRRVQAASMLGHCFMEKKLYSLAINALQEALDNIVQKDEAYWNTKYYLAEAYEKNDDLKRALDLYIDIYGWDSKFRDIGEKVNTLKEKVAHESSAAAVTEDAFKQRKDRISYL